MIHSSNGRSRSERTMEELEKGLAQELEHLSAEERETFELMLEEFRNEQEKDGLAELIGNAEWRTTPCDIETFVKDPYFLGVTCENLYPRLLADMVELFDGGYSEAVLTGCIELGAIVQSVNGSLHTIGEWIGKSGQVLGFSEVGGVPAATGLARFSGTLPVVHLELANGMQQRLTPDHQVVVWRDGFKWLPAGEVVPDDLITVARRIETSPDSDLSEDEAKLLAYWCTSGSSSEQRSLFSDGNPATSLEVVILLSNLGFSGGRAPKGDRCWEVYVYEHKRSGFLSWLREHGGGAQTADVVVPDSVCRSSRKIVAAFLNRVWAAEGCVYCNPSKSPPRFTLGMTSERFVRQIQLLLLRFGVASRLQFTPQFDKRSGLTTASWILSVTGVGPLKRMLAAIGPVLGKEEACSRVAAYCAGRVENTNVDIVPISRKWLSKEMTQRGIARSRGSQWWYLASGSGQYLSRSLFEEWLLEFGTTPLGKELEARFPPDLGFERVAAIFPAGEAKVGDICDVQEVSSFLSNGIYSHNSIGWGKCLKISSTYVTTSAGKRELLQDLIGRTPLVPSLQADGRIDYAEAAQIWHSGEKECARLTLASGQWLEASWDHPVLAPEGYKPLDALVVGGFVAAARTAPEPEHYLQISDAEVMCLGFYLADGSGLATGRQEYCKGNPDLVRLFEENAAKVPGFTGFGEKQYERGAWYVRPHGLLPWLRAWGIDEKSKEKRLPGRLFGLPRRQVALLLRVLWTDGNVYTGTPRKLELCLASEGLIDDVQEILRRFSIVARKSYQLKSIKSPDGSKKEYPAWRLQIADAATLRLFLNEVGPIFGLEQECARMLEDLQDVKSNPNWDVVPITIEELKKIRRSIGSIPNAEWSQYGSLAKGSHMGRSKFRALVAHFGYSGPYAKFASMDVVWERVVSVSSIGVHEVADLTVPGPANVVANGIVAHNTFFASLGICRILYELSCMKNPQRSFGLASQSGIAITNMSVTESLAIKVVFENIATKIKCSPYFQENFPFSATRKELRFPNSIWVAARSSTDTSALGLNTISGIVDESNFFAKSSNVNAANTDLAESIYATMRRRMKSRFERQGKLPGMLFVVSSKRTNDDFTARRIISAAADPTVFVRDYCLTGDTRIPLLDGSTMTLSELEAKFAGTEDRFWIYSFDRETERVVPGRAHHPRLTARQENVLKVGLDNGEFVRATPWHPFLLRSGEYCRADALKVGDSLMRQAGHFSPGNHKIVSIESGGVEDVYDLTVEKYENFALAAGIFVKNSLWDVKPEDYFDAAKFWVLVGNDKISSKILDPGEERQFLENPQEGTVVFEVPEDFRMDFQSDLEGAIRDIGGIATVSVNPYIQRRDTITSAIDSSRKHPFSELIYDPARKGSFMWDQMIAARTERVPGGQTETLNRPRLNPMAPRAVHIDPSLRGDATGLVMAHIGGWKDVVRRADDGSKFMERAPIYVVDLALKIIPPMGGEIVLGELRHLIYDLTRHGYMITGASLDSFQSADTIQQLKSQGYRAEICSVDTSPDPYDNLKTAFYEGRVSMYHYQPLISELEALQEDRRGKKRKIDHPQRGSKDVADSLAGVCFQLRKYSLEQPLPMLQSMNPDADPWLTAAFQSHGIQKPEVQSPSSGTPKSDILPPFIGSGFS